MDNIQGYAALGVIVLLVLIVAWKLSRALENSDNDIEWYQLISSEGKDKRQYASATKVCLLMTFFVATLLITYIAFQVEWKDRATEVVSLIVAWMLFGAGVEGYAKHLRAKSDVADTSIGKGT
jgi:hypothetical protein